MTLTEVAEALGVSPATVRHWSTAFAILLSSEARCPVPGADRHYTDEDLAMLREVHLMMAGHVRVSQAFEQLDTLKGALAAREVGRDT